MTRIITAIPLTREAFAPFGEVIEIGGDHHFPINGGKAERYHALATADATGPNARVLISTVRGTPYDFPLKLTMVERHTGRGLERYGLTLADLFAGPESVLSRVVEEHLGADTAKSFTETEESVNQDLDRLREKLRAIDPTLGQALETGRRKINYQLEGLRSRFHRAQMSRDETAHRQLQRAFDQLYPEKDLQERHINISSLLARHGRGGAVRSIGADETGANTR